MNYKLDADPPTRHPFKVSSIDSLNKDSYKRYRQPHPWSIDGLKEPSKGFTLYKELNAVYNALHNKFFNLNKQAFPKYRLNHSHNACIGYPFSR